VVGRRQLTATLLVAVALDDGQLLGLLPLWQQQQPLQEAGGCPSRCSVIQLQFT
jgi:hypothetical protein